MPITTNVHHNYFISNNVHTEIFPYLSVLHVKYFVAMSIANRTLIYMSRWPTAVSLLTSGAIDIKPMITHYFKLEETLKAFETAKSGTGVKVIIDCEKKD